MYNNNKNIKKEAKDSFQSLNQWYNNDSNSAFRLIPIVHVNSADRADPPQSFRSSLVTHVVDRASQLFSQPTGYNQMEEQLHSYDNLKYQTMPNHSNQNYNKYNSNSVSSNEKNNVNRVVNIPSDFRSYNTMPKLQMPTHEDEVDALTHLLVQSMEAVKHPDFYGVCYKCGHAIVGSEAGCLALDRAYHTKCFTCSTCNTFLKNYPFFVIDKKNLCEECYMNSLENCDICCKPISEKLVRTRGRTFHARCFKCVECDCSLDGMPFTLDNNANVYCIGDYQRKCAVRCSLCQLPITQLASNSERMIQVVALKRNFHLACYRCEDCNIQLSLEQEERGCYPLDLRILCRTCNFRRSQQINRSSKLSTGPS